ncbi:MAG: acyl-CoA mutase large subunit family protein [Ectobacillus sp.]
MEKETFQEFEGVSYETWKQLAEKTLKGKPFDSIFTATYENIVLKPLYTKEDAKTIEQIAYLLGESREGIAQELSAGSPAELNAILQQAIQNGQSILHLLVDGATLQGKDSDSSINDIVLQNGVPINSVEDLESLFGGIDVTKHAFLLYTGFISMPLLSLLLAYAKQKGCSFESLQGTIGADPLGYLAGAGQMPFSLEQSYDAMATTVKWSKQHVPQIRTVFVRTDVYHNAGANAVQELAIALATAAAYIREGIQRGIPAEDVSRQLTFSFSVGTHLFMEIAKLRAIRILWKKVAESFGASDEASKTKLHVRTSKRTKTVYDPYVNLLRATTEAFSAIVGGADTLHVSAYDEVYGQPDENGERWARNIQHILHGESRLSKVLDPARGSYYVEALTEELAKQAWSLFQQIEAKGGMRAVLEQGWIQEEIAKVAKKRYQNVVSLKQKIVGTNIYVNQDETRLKATAASLQEQKQRRISELIKYKEQRNEAVLNAVDLRELSLQDEQAMDMLLQAFASGMTVGEAAAALGTGEEKIEALKPMRDSEPFEVLREAAEKYEQAKGVRPKAAVIQVGEEGMMPRALTTALESSGFAISAIRISADEYPEAAKGAQAIFLSGDKERLEAILPYVLEGGAKIFLAGRFEEEYKKAALLKGVNGFVHETGSLIPLLYELHNELEVIV